jgi:YVTN family beta-propeller protein
MRLFSMISGQARTRLVQMGAVCAVAALVSGCGNNYRPVVTPVASTGPAAQPASYAVVVSAPAVTSPGIVTMIDFSGDTTLAQAPIGPGPSTFSIDWFGANGYTVNSDGTLSNFPVSTSLQAKNVTYTTLPTTFRPVNFFTPSSGLYATDISNNSVDVFSGFPQAYKLSVPVAPTPVIMTGAAQVSQRDYVISQGNSQGGNVASGVTCNQSPSTASKGEVDSIEVGTFTVSAQIPVGKCPVYGLESPDTRRVFVLNRGDDTITVINGQTNTSDSCTPFQNQNGQWVTCHPTLTLSLGAISAMGITPPNGSSGMVQTAGPVFAEYNPATAQLIVADYDGGTISVIDVSEDEYGNDSNTYANPNCTVNGVTSYANCGAITGGFGTTFTIPVGNNPASVTALADGSRAYTANQTDGTVSIVNLTSHTFEKTLPVAGHPRTVVSTQNSLYGKIYVASPDSPILTIIGTALDLVDTTIPIEGNIVDVRVTTQNGSQGNAFVTSRVPGYGQPCYLPPALTTQNYGANYTLQNCSTLP